MAKPRRLRAVTLVVLLTLTAAEIGARILEPRLPPPQLWDSPFVQDKATRIAELGDVDVAVIGSSIANASIDVTALVEGISWARSGYNASNPGAPVREWEAWDDDVVLPQLCPEVVVIAIGPRDTNDNEPNDEGELNSYLASEGRRRLYGRATMGEEIESFFQDAFALIAIRGRLREPRNLFRYLRGESVSSWKSNLTSDGRFPGFDGGHYEDDAERDRRLRDGELSNYQAGGIQFSAIEQIVTDIEATGAVAVIVDMPLMEAELAGVLDDGWSDIEDYQRALQDLESRTGVAVLSYDDMDDRGVFYADLYHMALPGTREISPRIGEDIGVLVPEKPDVECAARPPYRAPVEG